MGVVEDLARTIETVALAFDELGIEWAVGGSLASTAYGEPRATNDIDVAAALTPDSARLLVQILGEEFYADEDAAVDAAAQHSSFNIVHQRTIVKVDIFVPAPGPLGLGQLVRRRPMSLFPGLRPIPFLGPEDIVLQKLQWYVMGNRISEIQWRDILSVLSLAEAPLDDAYLDDVAGAAGLGDLLDRARGEARSP